MGFNSGFKGLISQANEFFNLHLMCQIYGKHNQQNLFFYESKERRKQKDKMKERFSCHLVTKVCGIRAVVCMYPWPINVNRRRMV